MTRVVRETAAILVADDDPTVLQVTAIFLNRCGYKVLTAQDGEAALKAFEQARHPIQLVISDVLMPGMKGMELVRSIRSLSPSTAALLMSGTQAFAPDGIALIAKPFTRKALVAKVQDLLAACDFSKIEREQSMARARRLAVGVKLQDIDPAGAPLRDVTPQSEEPPRDPGGKE